MNNLDRRSFLRAPVKEFDGCTFLGAVGFSMKNPTTEQRNILILSFTLVVVMLGYGMVIPIIPFYVENMGAGGTELGMLVASYALMRLVFGPIWGSLSDRIGRKPVLMIGVFGYAIAMFFFGLATQLWMLFAARVLSGILSSATAPTTMAYIGDSTPEEERGGGMGMMGAAVGLGTVLGPGLGGLLSGSSLATPFFIAAGLSLLSVVLIYLLLPESLPAGERRSSAEKLHGLRRRDLWQALSGPIGILLILAFMVTAGITTFYGIFGLYALERYNYGPKEVGVVMMVMGLVSAVAQGGLSGPFTRRFGDAAVIKSAMLVSTLAYLFMLPADTFITLLLATGFFFLITALLIPALTSLTSRLAPMEQGITMGLSNSFMSLGRIVGPLWGGWAFDMSINLPFLSGAGILFVGFIVSLFGLARAPEKASGVGLQSSIK
jgi:DHA1 family multidrug resistance protein-like MFS transporter